MLNDVADWICLGRDAQEWKRQFFKDIESPRCKEIIQKAFSLRLGRSPSPRIGLKQAKTGHSNKCIYFGSFRFVFDIRTKSRVL